MDLKHFKKEFTKIKKMGFIKSKRKGPTGIGYTLEDLLRIKENNISVPDLGEAELKAHREKSQNLITLFTFNNKAWKIPPLQAIRKYGSKDKNGRLGLYYTMSLKPNSNGLFLNVTKETIAVHHISGEVVVKWNLSDLANRFREKIPALVFVSAFCEERDNIEYFRFYRAQFMTGASPELLFNQFKAENIVVDLRLHDKGTMARNHGTGFRCYEDKLPTLFERIEDLK